MNAQKLIFIFVLIIGLTIFNAAIAIHETMKAGELQRELNECREVKIIEGPGHIIFEIDSVTLK